MERVRTKRKFTIAALVILLGAFILPAARAGEVIDRIVATVNGRIILQSDWDEALCYEALLNGRSLSDFTDDDRRTVLDRLIDQELLQAQMKSARFLPASEPEAAAHVTEARKLYPVAATDQGWQFLLANYHLTEKDLLAHVREQIDVLLRGLSGHDLDLRCLRRRRHILQVDGRYRYVAGHPHDLVRLSVDIYERRPQHLVPLGHILQGLC